MLFGQMLWSIVRQSACHAKSTLIRTGPYGSAKRKSDNCVNLERNLDNKSCELIHPPARRRCAIPYVWGTALWLNRDARTSLSGPTKRAGVAPLARGLRPTPGAYRLTTRSAVPTVRRLPAERGRRGVAGELNRRRLGRRIQRDRQRSCGLAGNVADVSKRSELLTPLTPFVKIERVCPAVQAANRDRVATERGCQQQVEMLHGSHDPSTGCVSALARALQVHCGLLADISPGKPG